MLAIVVVGLMSALGPALKTDPARVALWLAGNRSDAEDLLQRTFLKAIETRHKFRHGEPVLPWLMGLLGHEGRALTPLRPSGLARIDGRRVAVTSGTDWLEAGTPVVVASVESSQALVERSGS